MDYDDYIYDMDLEKGEARVYNDKHLTEENVRLQNLVNDMEAANIRRQGVIESLQAELSAVHSSYQEKLNAKKMQVIIQNEELKTLRKTRKNKIVDYTRVDQDLLVKYALAKLNSYDSFEDYPVEEVESLEKEIEKAATFEPHVQQQIVTDEHGTQRFRKNALVERLVSESGGHGLIADNYVASIEATREDRAQLAQLLGYSVDGYQSLSYAMPLEEGEDE